jgi:asparagine synthase (glutamine-hydrolysing)
MCGFIFTNHQITPSVRSGISHRGPDSQIELRIGEFHLFFARLEITGGIQGNLPVISGNGRYSVFLNGEIYNFKKLIKKFGIAETNSDTQVIANGLEVKGLDFLLEIRGMFAGVIHDHVDNEIYFFRDPLGEKPLFIGQTDKALAVGSEFRAVLRTLDKEISIDSSAVQDYFDYGYITEPRTIDTDIQHVGRGGVYRLTPNRWNPLEKILTLIGYSDEEVNLDLKSLLKQVSDEVVSCEVPTGIALSSGVDSNAILNLSAETTTEVSAITIKYDKYPKISEGEIAEKNALKLGLKVYSGDPYREFTLTLLKELAILNDQPHADMSGLGYLEIFKIAKKEGLKVVFVGHGPDEFFWGYPWLFNQISMKSTWHKLLKRFVSFRFNQYPSHSIYANYLKTRLDNSETTNFGSADKYFKSTSIKRFLRACIAHSYLSTNGFVQSDRLGMSQGIEVRSPLADSRIYGWAQVNADKVKNWRSKGEFIESLKSLGLEINYDVPKTGFRSPLSILLLEKGFTDETYRIRDYLIDIEILSQNARNVPLDDASENYRLLMLGYWLQN